MSSIFNALNIGYSGLKAAETGISVTGHNIANAETEGYSRQRVVQSAATPLNTTPGNVGNGVDVDQIARVFDQFVYDRYTSSAQNKEGSDFSRQTLEELSSYFLEIDNVGVKNDMQEYFNLWQSLADNPDSTAIKVALAQQTQTLSDNVSATRERVFTLQQQINDEMDVAVDEVNRIASSIADLNKSINEIESVAGNNANDLRDQRNLLELSLSKLIGADTLNSYIVSDSSIDSRVAEAQGPYTIQVAGFNIVDGGTFHPIGTDNSANADGFSELYYERQDGIRIPLESEVYGGKIGAILELRGAEMDSLGIPQDGDLQDTINQLDAFAEGLINYTNNIYANSVSQVMTSKEVDIRNSTSLIDTEMQINTGDFSVKIYDADGNEVANRDIFINTQTVMDASTSTFIDKDGVTRQNSIVEQLSMSLDDNDDNNSLNDLDDMFSAVYVEASGASVKDGQLNFAMNADFRAQGYTFAIVDNTTNDASGTNFGGALGMNRFFDGDDATNIDLNASLKADPTQISAHAENVAGNNDVAISMVQFQFESVKFTSDGLTTEDTVYGYYDSLVTAVGTKTNSAISKNETLTAQFAAIELEYNSVSKVSIDEELTNLIKYQTSYGAAAKVITTVDQMMQTLLGIKQ